MENHLLNNKVAVTEFAFIAEFFKHYFEKKFSHHLISFPVIDTLF